MLKKLKQILKPEFTKGPWAVASSGWGDSGGNSGGAVEAIRPTGKYIKNEDGSFSPEVPLTGTQICYYFTSRLPDGEGMANARLVSAAPDLYEALKLLRSVRSIDNLSAEQLHQIDDALAKAIA